jgi:D-glycero-D-manno-heptose 1,7-bisphosphate phosphatase
MSPVGTVFLDRDGVLNRKRPEGEWVTRWEEFEWLPGALRALRCLHRAGLRLIVITNQRGVALGRLREADLAALHHRLRARLAVEGVSLAGIYACPHDRDCRTCRKPGTGLFLRARQDFPDIDFPASLLVGDSLSDMEAGSRVGCRCFLVADGGRREAVLGEARRRGLTIHGQAPSLYEVAARFLLPRAAS